MKYLSDYTEEPISAMLKKHGAFFAFSMDQFEAAKDPALTPKDYCHIMHGMYAPKVNADQIIAEYHAIVDKAIEEDLAENGEHNIILRELNNHECFYTGDVEDAYLALIVYPDMTMEKIQAVFKNKTNPAYETRTTVWSMPHSRGWPLQRNRPHQRYRKRKNYEHL